MRLIVLIAIPALAGAAEYCSQADVEGAWGIQLAGSMSVSGGAAPAASVGRLSFESGGAISGYSSVNFNGYFLGNPVTGDYHLANDCALTWRLQDDSGAWQRFSGKLSRSGKVDFRQTEPATNNSGVMKRVSSACGAAGFRGPYSLTMTGMSTPFTGGAPRPSGGISLADADGNGNLQLLNPKGKTNGSYTVDSDCFMQIELILPAADGSGGDTVRLRGVLVDGGKEALAIQTDPKQVSAARFTAR
jgi:hypothetical protein